MVSGIPLILGLGTRMSDPYVFVGPFKKWGASSCYYMGPIAQVPICGCFYAFGGP